MVLRATALKKETENAVGSEPVVPEVRHPKAHGRTGWRVEGGGFWLWPAWSMRLASNTISEVRRGLAA